MSEQNMQLTKLEQGNRITLVRVPRKVRRIIYDHIPGDGHQANSLNWCFSSTCGRERAEQPEVTVLALRECDLKLELLLEEVPPEWVGITSVEITESAEA